MTDRPTGPATRFHYDFDAVNDLLRAATNVWVRRGPKNEDDWTALDRALTRTRESLSVETDDKARILAALPEALREVLSDVDPIYLGRTTLEQASRERAAALAAAIEAQLSREPGEEG